MKIPSYFVREEEQYTKTGLFKKFCLAEETGEKFLSLLLQYRVLTPLKPTSPELVFKFSFVGIVFFQNLSIRCYPKYIRNCATPRKAFAQVMNVLRCYGRQSNAEFYPGGEGELLEFSLIAEALALLEDHAEYGLYANTVSDSEYNGTGEILWDKTLSSLEPFFCNEIPLYLDFHTKKTVDDTNDYVTRLHKLILTECSRLLEDADLLSIFDFSPLRLSDEPREHFGPEEYILRRLRAELDIQFECHKQELLRRLIRFIERRETLSADSRGCTTLMSLIKRPEWHLASGTFSGNGTLIPDIAAFYDYKGKTVFMILDAKYYDPSTLTTNYPGIGDIDKQYLYEVAFKPFLNTHGIQQIQNIFLLPGEEDEVEYRGYVEFAMLKNLGCENIKIVLLPAQKAFASYLNEATKENLAESVLRKLYE